MTDRPDRCDACKQGEHTLCEIFTCSCDHEENR